MLALLCLWLAACGGGGGGGNDGGAATPPLAVAGMAVKGPLAQARVQIFAADPGAADLAGTLLAEGTTDGAAQFTGLELPRPLATLYLVRVISDAATLDLATGQTPFLPQLEMLVSGEHLEDGGALYPTPQTTVAVALVRNGASDSQSPTALQGEFLAALEGVRTSLGFGLAPGVDLMNTPPVLDAGADAADLRQRVAYRTAIESLGAVLARLAQDTGLAPVALVDALGVDLADGALDGQGTAGPVAALAALGDVAAWFAALPVPHLPVPNADGGGAPIPVAETLDMMAGEASALGVSWQGAPGGADIAFRPVTIGTDTDADGWPDGVDPDDDNDAVPDSVDAFPLDPLESVDTDGDGVGNNADPDDDNDSFDDPLDEFALDPAEHKDHDGDGLGDNADQDDDNDSIPDAVDPALLLGALSGEVAAAVLDAARQRIYATVPAERKLYAVDAITGAVLLDVPFDLTPERLTLSHDGTELYVALLAQPHSPYWWTEQQYGFIATVNLATGTESRRLRVATDPYDLVVTDAGKLVVTSGSGQWSRIYAYNIRTGAELGFASIRESSRLALHPNQRWVYAADTDLSPSDLRKYDIGGTGIIYTAESPYHGDHRISGGVYVTPDGRYLITRGGDVFRSSSVLAEDFVYVTSMAAGPIENLYFDVAQGVVLALEQGAGGQGIVLRTYNLQSFALINEVAMPGDGSAIFPAGPDLLLIGGAQFDRVSHPCPDCGANTVPVAAFLVTPASGGDTGTTFQFDAGTSTDAESSLQYRWDWEADGIYDTGFSPVAIASKRFNLAGSKQIKLQVKDAGGMAATVTRTLNVAQGVDSGLPGDGGTAFELQFTPADAEIDPARNRLYVTDKSNRRLYVVDTNTGVVDRYFEFDYMPERMTMSPDGRRLYVALLVQDHSSYWWEEDQSGYIAEFDLEAGAKVREFLIGIDPYDLVVTDGGKLVISSGSGQWTYIYAYQASTGLFLGQAGIRQASRLTLHPDQQRVYATDTDSSPSDIERFDIGGPGIVALGDSPYHGDHRVSGDAWVTPDGLRIITRGGDVFRSEPAIAGDMLFEQSLTGAVIASVAFDAASNVLVTIERGVPGLPTATVVLRHYNLSSLELIGEDILSGGARHVWLAGSELLILADGGAGATLSFRAHPCPACGSNELPTAEFSVTPATGTTLDDYVFDASLSTDPGDTLVYRWDWQSDGIFDTPFTGNGVAIREFSLGGTKNVTLQVKDTAGAVATRMRSVDVVFAADPGDPGNGGPAFALDFQPADTILDAARGQLYLTNKAARKLVVLDASTGLVSRTFSFVEMPERMAISPDGTRLYVALLVQEHSSYWWEEDQSGYVAVFDLGSLEKIAQFLIGIDPYDLVATNSGKVIVASGSGQWTYINAYQAATGQFLGQAGIRQQSRLVLHPNQQWVYAADTDSSPSDMEKFDISGPGITPLYEMAYHGDHRVWGNVFVLPGGQLLVTAGGDIFTSSGLQAADMQFVTSLTPRFIRDLYVDAANGLIFTLETPSTYDANSPVTLHWYNLQSLLQVGQQTVVGGNAVYVDAGQVYVIANGVPESVIGSLAHPCPDCGSNISPDASFTVDPAIGGDTTTTFQFDATASADEESGAGELLVRWDWESDGVWDTLFSPTMTASHRYILPGSYAVSLQVIDDAGAVDIETSQVAVVQGIDPGTTVSEPGVPYAMDFVPLDAALAPGQAKLYLSAPGEQRVYVMDLGTGVLEKYFDSLFIPERMAVTPAGDRLYLAQPVGPHNSYQFDEQEGYIAEFDLVNGTKLRDFFVAIDPYDLVVNGAGKLVISSGSSQWTDIQAYRTSDGALVGTAFIRQQSRLTLHPSGSWVYAADTDLSPSDIRKFDISGAGILALNDSPYHGDHRMAGNVYAASSGTWLVTRGGDVFSSSAVQSTDMLYQGALTPNVIEAAAFDDSADRLVTIEQLPGSAQVLRVYRISDRVMLDEMALAGAGIDVIAQGGVAYVVRQDDGNPSGGARVQVVPLP